MTCFAISPNLPYGAFMTLVIPIPAIAGGALAALLYALMARGWIVGITAPLIPLFILSLCGMVYGRAGVQCAAAVMAALVLVLLPFSQALMLIASQIVPVVLAIRMLMTALLVQSAHDQENYTAHVHFAPLNAAIMVLTLYGALYYGAMMATDNAMYHQLVAVLQQEGKAGLAQMDPEIKLTAEAFIDQLPHILIAMEYCLWCGLLLTVMLGAHYVADTFGIQRRPTPRLYAASPPNILLMLLGGSAALSFVGYDPLVHASQAASMILLLPYFFFGIGLLHRYVRSLRHSGLWFGVFYVLVALTLWPLLLVTLYGLLRHISRLSLPSGDKSL